MARNVTARFSVEAEGVDKVRRDLEGLTQQTQKLGATKVDGVRQQLEGLEGAAGKAATGYRSLTDAERAAFRQREEDVQQVGRLQRSFATLGGALEALDVQVRAGHRPVEGATRLQSLLVTAYAKTGNAAKQAAQDERAALAKMSADWDAAVREREADAAMIMAAEREAAAAVKAEETALRSLVGTLDKTFGAEERLTQQQRLLDRARRDGIGGIKLSEDQHKALSAALKEQHEIATRTATSTKLAAHESLNLGYQLQDFVVQVGSGQGIITPLLQQAPQAVGAVGGVGRAVALMTSPIALATMGTLALGGAMAVVIARAIEVSAHTRRLSVDIQAMGNASGVSAGQLRAIETQLRQQGVSGDAAFASVRTLAGARGLPSSMLGDVASIGRNMAAGTDDVAEAVKGLTDALTEGYAGIRKLDDQYNFLTVDERRQIETMARHGDQAGVLKTAIDALHRQFDGLHEKALSPAGAAMERLSAGYNRLLDSIASRPIVIKGLEALALLLDKTAGSIGEPTKVERIAGIRRELSDLDAQYSRLPEATSGIQASHEAVILRRIDLMQQLAKLEKESAAGQSSQISTGAPRTAGTSNARSGMPDPAAAKYVSEQAAAFEHLSEAMQGNAVQRTLAQADMRAEEEIRDRRLRGLAADEIRTIRRKEALLQLSVAVDDNARAAAADVAGNELVARAYDVSTAAVREATLHQKAMAEAARGTIEPYDAIVARLRAVDDAQRAVQAAQYDQTLRQQAEDAERLAVAWGQGADAAREAALANEVLAEARKRGLDPDRDGAEISNIGDGVWARDQAQRTQQFAQMASEQRRSVELANAEFETLGQSNAERAKTVAILQATNDLRDKGADLTDAGTKAYIAQAGELARVQSILQDSAQTAANIAQPISSAFEDVLVGATKAGDAVKALGEDFRRIAARQLVTKPLETWMSGTLTRLMSGGVSVANDNRPTPANDPGGLDRLITSVRGGLGSSADNAMWVRMSSGGAALDASTMLSGSPLPVAIQDGGSIVEAIRSEARAQGVPEEVALSIARLESNFQQFRADGSVLRSSAGAMGVMQLMPDTAKWLGVDASDTRENVRGGIKYLAMLGRQFGGDWSQVAGAYNAGPGRMTQHLQQGRALPAETVTYIEKFGSSVKTASAAMVDLRSPVLGITAAQEQQLQHQLDAVPVQRAATDSVQTLTAAQQGLINSVLGNATATADATAATVGTTAVIDVQSRSISALGANAISVAEGLGDAADGASTLADASQDSSNILLRGAQTVYSGFTSVMGSLWSTVSGLFSGGTGAAASAAGQAAQPGNPLGSLSQIGQLASAGQSAYTAFTGGYASMGTQAGTWLANSQLGVSMGWSTAQPVVGAVGPQLPYAMTGSGQAMVGTMGDIAAGLPFGALGGIGGGYIGTATNSKLIGGLSGAALGAGSAFGYEAIFGAGSAGGPWGIAAAAVVAAVMAVLGTQKKSVGPNAAGNLYVDSSGAKSGPSAGDNGMDGGALKDITDATALSVNTIVSSIGSTFKKGLGEQNLAHLTYYQEGNKWTLQNMRAGDTVGEKQSFETQEELVQALIRQTLQRLDQGGQVSPFSADVRTALTNSKATTAEDLAADITFADGFRDQLSLMQQSLDPTSNQIKTFSENAKQLGENVKSAILDWRDKAVELGLATESEMVPALRKGLLAMMGLGPAAQPLLGLAAVTKQATIEFEAYKPALESLGYTAAEVTNLAVQYTAKAQKAYQDAVAYTKRSGAVSVEALVDPTAKTSAADRLQGLGLDPTNSAIGGLAGVIGNLDAAAKVGTLSITDIRWALGQVDAQLDAGILTADQYTTVVGYLTQAWGDSADAASKALEKLRKGEDLTARALRGLGLDDQAEDMERGLSQSREIVDAVAAGYDSSYIAGLRYVHWLENVAVATERTTAALQKQVTADNARADIFTRAVSASGNSVWAATLRFDLDANKQRGDAWNNGLRGQDLTNLDAVLAAERGETIFRAAQQSVLDWYDREISAKQELVTSIQDGALKVAQAAKQFQAAADAIRISDDAPISPQQRLTEAKRQWDVALATVRSDKASESDKDTARSALTSLGQTLVSIEKTNSAGTADTLYKEVLAVLDGLGDVSALGAGVATAEADLKVAQDQLKELQRARTEAANYGQRTVGNLESLVATMKSSREDWAVAITGIEKMLGTSNDNVVAPDKGGSVNERAASAGAWMAEWFQRFDQLVAGEANGSISAAQVKQQGAALWQEKVDKANALPMEQAVWAAVIGAARQAPAGGPTADWLAQVAHDKGVPGFAVGTLATPPGAVWVGERGPELLWQSGGAAVASSADSLRIAGLYESAVNDRWAATNVSSYRPAAPARPARGDDGTTAIVSALARIEIRIAQLEAAIHEAEGGAQVQRARIAADEIKLLKQQLSALEERQSKRAA